jgi:hypothetical protein
MVIAEAMNRRCQTEYGIKVFTFNKTWKHILADAKTIAEIKLKSLTNKNGDYLYNYQKNILEKILNS